MREISETVDDSIFASLPLLSPPLISKMSAVFAQRAVKESHPLESMA